MSAGPPELTPSAARNRASWDAFADEYQATHGEVLTDEGDGLGHGPRPGVGAPRPRRRGRQGRPRVRLRRGAVVDRARALGARPVGLDNSARQLEHARRFMAEAGVDFPLVHASAEAVPLPGRLVRHRVLRPRRDDVRRPVPRGPRGGPPPAAGRPVRVQRPLADRDDLLGRRCRGRSGHDAGEGLLRDARGRRRRGHLLPAPVRRVDPAVPRERPGRSRTSSSRGRHPARRPPIGPTRSSTGPAAGRPSPSGGCARRSRSQASRARSTNVSTSSRTRRGVGRRHGDALQGRADRPPR